MKTSVLFLLCMCSTLFCQVQEKIGGYVLPSEGHVNTLYIFAQFPDDNQDPGNAGWKKGQPISNMSSWADDMRQYFLEMSGNKFNLTGKSVSVITPHTRQWYLDNKKVRYDIQKEIIQELNKKMDFAEFDNWSLNGAYNHENKPDGIVDFIFFVWRNISHDLPDVSVGASKMDFGRYGDLGRRDPIPVDNGKRIIKTGFDIDGRGQPGGSGITICDYFNENMFRFCIHEFAHYLEGGNSMHTGYGFWGMCSAYGVRNFIINSYERYKLGWGDIVTIPYSDNKTTRNITLPDFITSGKALRIGLDQNGTKFIFIENHQVKSRWEKDTSYGKILPGIYVMRQDGPNGEDVHLIPAEGKYDWEVNQVVQSPWGKEKLPVFKITKPDRENGYSDLDRIPYKIKNVIQPPMNIYFTEDPNTGKPVEDVTYKGSPHDAFDIGYKEVFSPYSNPNSQLADKKPSGFGFKLTKLSGGVYTLDIYQGTSLEAPPSKPELISVTKGNNGDLLLNWDPNIEPDVINSGKYKILRAVEENRNPGKFTVIGSVTAYKGQTPVNSWTDLKNNMKGKIFYRIIAVDSKGKESLPSEYKFIQKTD